MADEQKELESVACRAQKEIMACHDSFLRMAEQAALRALLTSGKVREEEEITARKYYAQAEAFETAARIIGKEAFREAGLPV